ncbi:unnamed protein product [Phaedon cochleariae]|uniref:4-nitrophenylphosphatase n=1 Tax=Phaedon cochleariae TaxID=80249 RepID=A0A9N9SH90_PHACE|nr:unnamed protein product [Phaedon cochleariae]
MLRNLAQVPLQEQLDFIDSFDHVVSDIDGVLWVASKTLPGSPECIATFKNLGKRVNYVTNQAVNTVDAIYGRMKQCGISGEPEDIVNPLVGVVDYLKKIKFNKELFVLASNVYKNELRKAGFKVAPDPPQIIDESISGLLSNITDDENIGAVVYDYDLNLTFVKLQKCLTYLKRKDCLFIVGGGDKQMPVGELGPIFGNHYFYQGLREISGREPIQFAKPSVHYNEFIVKKFNITDPKKVLFIGDMINEDMKFAAVGGYHKLLVLTGTATKEDVMSWKHPEDCKPTYYVDSLGVLNEIMQCFNDKKHKKL